MTKYRVKTILVSDAHLDGHLVEIFIHNEEIAYLEQELPFSSTKITLLSGASHFPKKIKDQAIELAKTHLFNKEREGMSTYQFNENTSPEAYNQAGDELIERILNDPTKKIFQHYYDKLGKNILDFFEKNGNGCGARFTEDGGFIGFVDKQEKEFKMTKWETKTIIVSDINNPGFLAEIYINDKEIGYIEQKEFHGEFKTIIHQDEDSANIPPKILEQAAAEALEQLKNFVKNKSPQAY